MSKPLFLRFSTQEQIHFAKRLSMMLRSGMPIMSGLHMLCDESRSTSAKHVYKSIVSDVSVGLPLSSALEKFERIFGKFCINIVQVGEKSGTLHTNLNYLAEELRSKQALRRSVVGALVYPAIIIAATTLITLMLTVFIFPKIVPIFQTVKATLPVSTRVLMSISLYLKIWGGWLFLAFIASTAAYLFVLRASASFHKVMDYILLRTPLFRRLSQFYNLATISRTLSILLKSDVKVVEAFELAAGSTRNLLYQESLLRARDEIRKGQKISTQFKHDQHLYPPLFAQMLSVGEVTGNLSGTFEFLSGIYEEDVTELTKNLNTLIEPVLMIVMGLLVGFIAISIIAPIYSITQNLQAH